MHGVEWKPELGELIKAGLKHAKANGIRPGRRRYAEREGGHELVDLARWLRRNERIERGKRIEGWPHSLRTVAAGLADYGYVTPSGRPLPLPSHQ
jgi:hypothetical protein